MELVTKAAWNRGVFAGASRPKTWERPSLRDLKPVSIFLVGSEAAESLHYRAPDLVISGSVQETLEKAGEKGKCSRV